jgi:hypothetical protein
LEAQQVVDLLMSPNITPAMAGAVPTNCYRGDHPVHVDAGR